MNRNVLWRKVYKIDNLHKFNKLSIIGIMQTISATKASQNFAAMIDAAQREPVKIQRHDRDVAVLISAEDYARLSKDPWAEFNRLSAVAAEQAQANGLTEKALAEILAD
jgi:prevent-host-death family protein